jgi:hypothetical protein
VAAGNVATPDIVAVAAVKGQKPCRVTGNEFAELAVSVCAALLQALFATVTSTAVIVQATGLPRVMTALPVTSTDVVLVAVAVHGPVVCTETGFRMLLEQPLNVGPAGVPPEFVVVATAPDALTKVDIVHVTVPEPEVNVRAAECPGMTVFCGVQLTAEADPAPNSAIIAEAAATAVPSFFMLRILLSFCRYLVPAGEMDRWP